MSTEWNLPSASYGLLLVNSIPKKEKIQWISCRINPQQDTQISRHSQWLRIYPVRISLLIHGQPSKTENQHLLAVDQHYIPFRPPLKIVSWFSTGRTEHYNETNTRRDQRRNRGEDTMRRLYTVRCPENK